MATLDLNIFPYEIYVNTSLERPYHPKCDCICKDILVQSLNDLLVIENFILEKSKQKKELIKDYKSDFDLD